MAKDNKELESLAVSLENFIDTCLSNDFSTLKNKKITLHECPFFVNTQAIYDNYYIEVTKHNCIYIRYGKDGKKSVEVDRYSFDKRRNKNNGLYYNARKYSSSILGLPSIKMVPTVLGKLKTAAEENAKTYKKCYEGATERLNKINELLVQYPEHMV